MDLTRREFIRNGVAAFTVGVAAPSFISTLARAQGASRRNLVVFICKVGTTRCQWSCRIRTRSTTTAVRRFPCRPDRCCRLAATSRANRWGCIRGSRACVPSSTKGIWRSCSGPATRTRAGRISSARTSGPRRIRRTPWKPAGSAGISTRCRRRSIRSRVVHGARRAAHARRQSRQRAGHRRSRQLLAAEPEHRRRPSKRRRATGSPRSRPSPRPIVRTSRS